MARIYLEEALKLIRYMQPRAKECNYYLTLAGGVLNNGYSDNDIDIVAIPSNNNNLHTDLVDLFNFHFTLIDVSYMVRNRRVNVYKYKSAIFGKIDLAIVTVPIIRQEV